MSDDPLLQLLFRNDDAFTNSQRGKVVLLNEFVHAGFGNTQKVNELLHIQKQR